MRKKIMCYERKIITVLLSEEIKWCPVFIIFDDHFNFETHPLHPCKKNNKKKTLNDIFKKFKKGEEL